MVIDRSHEGLTVYYPQFTSMDLVCANTSPEDDKNAIFSCAGAFTGSIMDEFQHTNIAGNHVSSSKFYKGYSCKKNTGAFVWSKGQWKFLLKNYAAELKNVADSSGSGMGFGQNMIIHNGKTQPLCRSNNFQYRALCEIDGKLCVVQSNESVPYKDFVDMLNTAKVTHAIYLDMGGWDHAWYRNWSDSDVTYINVSSHTMYTNWVTFYK